jgi:hypothetical protein
MFIISDQGAGKQKAIHLADVLEARSSPWTDLPKP